MARLAKLQASKSANVTDSPFRPSNPGKKGTYGMNKTNMNGKSVGSLGEYKYLEQVSNDSTSLPHWCAEGCFWLQNYLPVIFISFSSPLMSASAVEPDTYDIPSCCNAGSSCEVATKHH